MPDCRAFMQYNASLRLEKLDQLARCIKFSNSGKWGAACDNARLFPAVSNIRTFSSTAARA